MKSICTMIAQDIRHQYTLGYYPTNTKKDGTLRSLRVEVLPEAGGGKLTVRTRIGYFATRGDDRTDRVRVPFRRNHLRDNFRSCELLYDELCCTAAFSRQMLPRTGSLRLLGQESAGAT